MVDTLLIWGCKGSRLQLLFLNDPVNYRTNQLPVAEFGVWSRRVVARYSPTRSVTLCRRLRHPRPRQDIDLNLVVRVPGLR